jgi:hypothetical protein
LPNQAPRLLSDIVAALFRSTYDLNVGAPSK